MTHDKEPWLETALLSTNGRLGWRMIVSRLATHAPTTLARLRESHLLMVPFATQGADALLTEATVAIALAILDRHVSPSTPSGP